MFKKTVTFEDLNGVERTMDLYFNFSETELREMELGEDGGFAGRLISIGKSEDLREIFKMITDIVLDAYGERDADGLRFRKTEEIRKQFEESPMFDALMDELLGDQDKMIEFVNGLPPRKFQKKLDSPEYKEELGKAMKQLGIDE